MSGPYRPPAGRRLNSGAWSRLKPSAVDSLENVGLPSKGETRLNDFKAQEAYYQKIVDRWLKFCADTGNSTELDNQFAAMSVSNASQQSLQPASTTSVSASAPLPPSPELAVVLMAMRKLREAIVASSRVDDVAQKAYMFIIRTTILLRHWESYHAAILYLLRRIHPVTPLNPLEYHEFVSYHILELGYRQQLFNEAYTARAEHKFSDRKVDRLLYAVVHDDWVVFWRVKAKVDGHMRALLSWREDGMRDVALKCLARSYFTAERGFVERATNMEWMKLVKEKQVGWELEGEKVTIRRPKTK